MDFTFTPEQDDAARLAATILDDRVTSARMREIESAGDRFDRDLWSELGAAGLLSLHLPETHGGADLGLLELCRVVVEAGRRVAPVPLATHGAAGLALAELGTAAQHDHWLRGIADGATLATVALAEERSHLPEPPATSARPDGDDWVVSGTKTLVRSGMRAELFLVSAQSPTGAAVFLVTPDDAGVTRSPQRTSDGDTTAWLSLDEVRLPADRLLGDPDGTGAERLAHLAVVLAAAEQYGVVSAAVELTAGYAKQREQFARPIATFQAVSQRLADGYIDALFSGLVLWQAAWRLSEGLPAAVEVASAKLWAADAGHRIAHTTVHVHGGVGIDLDGEAHRYFTAAKRFELTFGGATENALAIGRLLAR